jgi:tripartite ATP-independent transporter DctM subunit
MFPVETITLLIVAGILAGVALGVPLAFASGAIAVGLTLWFFGPDALMLLSSRTYSFLDSYVLVSVPLFVFMASVLERSGLARDLYTAFSVWAGRLRGGVAAMTTLVGVVLAATVGVIGGEIVVLGLVALPQLLRFGYQRRLAIGTICSAGSLGTMIPPSIILVFYGLTANVPIGDLFVATLLPGLLLAALYIGYILVRCAMDPRLGPLPPPEVLDMPLGQKVRLLRGVALPVFIAFCVLGSIYLGVASVTESAGMGVAGTILACWIRGELRWSLLREAAWQTMSTCGVVLWLVLGTNALIGIYNLVGGIAYATEMFRSIPLPPLGVVLVMVGVCILMGMFLDWIGIMLLTMPVFVPTVVALGFDPLWFGILFNISMQIAYLTPPFAPAAFYLKGVAPPDMSLEEILGAMWPFVLLQATGLVIVIAVPQLATWLPTILG